LKPFSLLNPVKDYNVILRARKKDKKDELIGYVECG
jgi:hypothetical protein